MFTGIVEEKGKVLTLKKAKNLYVLEIQAPRIAYDLKAGDSVCVSGVCLTATKVKTGQISFDIMRATIEASSLGFLRPGNFVNCERALKVGSRFSFF